MTAGGSTPRVTVTIPTYNRAGWLGDAIRSVLDQTLTDFELFVSDNASTDDTADVVAQFDDPRLTYMRNDTNTGVHANLTVAYRVGSAPYVTVLQDDDRWLPRNLERKVELLDRDPSIGMVHSAVVTRHIAPNGRASDTPWYLGGDADSIEAGDAVVARLLATPYFIYPTAAVMRREYVDHDGHDEEEGPSSDRGLCLRVAHRSPKVGYLADPLSIISIHPEADSTQKGIHSFEEDSYKWSFTAVENLQFVKLRFLDAFGTDLADPRGLRRRTRTWGRDELLHLVRTRLGPDRAPKTTIRALRAASRVEPSVAWSPDAVRLVGGSVVREAARRVGRRPRRETPLP